MKIINKILGIPNKILFYFFIRFNKFILQTNKVIYGNNIIIYNSFKLIKHPNSIFTIGNNFTFTSGNYINPLCRNIKGCIYLYENSELTIGNNVGISSACLWVKERIKIGNNVKIGGDCIIMDTDAHNLNYKIRNSNNINEEGKLIDHITAKSKPINIEDDVLIGTRCIILKGVTIGARSIIGSGSVVTKSIPSDCIAAGNPCKVIRYINNE